MVYVEFGVVEYVKVCVDFLLVVCVWFVVWVVWNDYFVWVDDVLCVGVCDVGVVLVCVGCG